MEIKVPLLYISSTQVTPVIKGRDITVLLLCPLPMGYGTVPAMDGKGIAVVLLIHTGDDSHTRERHYHPPTLFVLHIQGRYVTVSLLFLSSTQGATTNEGEGRHNSPALFVLNTGYNQ